VAGVRSTFMSHGIDVRINSQVATGIAIGDYCLVSSNVALAPGSRIPSRSLVAMGAVVVHGLKGEGMLHAGVPAVVRKDVAGGAYFSRPHGVVLPLDEVGVNPRSPCGEN
jgi:acetyltransferase-like isoleucine patch superfamily enzyme